MTISTFELEGDSGVYNELQREESNRHTFEMFNDLKRRPTGRLKEGYPADIVRARVEVVLTHAHALLVEYQALVDEGKKEAIPMCVALASLCRRAARISRLLSVVMDPGEDYVTSVEEDMGAGGNR
ncbi:MAG: hypothetical protein EBS87_09920, partial [Sphingomonadaceae bacterium]|nr:hypothetical protein [Sphingomonadaceae bacterium]